MKAMVLDHTGDVSSYPLQLRDQPVPTPQPGQVLIKVHVCGVCRTDLHVIEGELPDPALPLIPGHQTVGTVMRIGSEVSEIGKVIVSESPGCKAHADSANSV